jgi:hypothetical protein
MATDATLAGPAGFLAAIDAKAARMGMDRAKLLQRAGVTQGAYDAFAAALTGASAETWRRLANAVCSQPTLSGQTAQVLEEAGGQVTSQSHGVHWQSHFGDLG